MVDQNKFTENFFELINNFQLSRNQSDGNQGSKRKESSQQNEKGKKQVEGNKEESDTNKDNEGNGKVCGKKRKAREDYKHNLSNKSKKRKVINSIRVDSKMILKQKVDSKNNKCAKKSNCDVKKNNYRTGLKKKYVSLRSQKPERRKGKEKMKLSNMHTHSRKTIMDNESLQDLLGSETALAVASLINPASGYIEMLKTHPLSSDLIILIIKLLQKISESEAYQFKMQIYSITFQPEFIDELKMFLSLSCVEEDRESLISMNAFFNDLLNVLGTLIITFPSLINYRLKSLLNALQLSMKSVHDDHKLDVDNCLFAKLTELANQVHSHIEHNVKIDIEQKFSNTTDVVPPDDYKNLPIIPTKEDFATDKVFLRKNVVKGSYNSVEHYLDVQFRLLREDFIAPLREGIREYIANLSNFHLKRKYSNVRFYPDVKFVNSYESKILHGFNIQFDREKRFLRHINWGYSKRFMSGSLLLFSDDHFQTFYLATVEGRNIKQLEEGLVFVTFVPGTKVPENILDDEGRYFMAESEVYYEAYRHVLSALKRMTAHTFPMKKYIIEANTAPSAPEYLKENSDFVISSFKVKILEDGSWPTADELNLNSSQHQALKSALTNEFCVIQGPPGTGKTFLALKITEILLANRVSKGSPIVVICYTNHALDQFLVEILKYTRRVIRIGMQSKNETLQDCTLEAIKKKSNFKSSFNYLGLCKGLGTQVFSTLKRLVILRKKIEEISNPKGVLELGVLKSVVEEKKYDQINGLEWSWLSCCDDPKLRSTKYRSEFLTKPFKKKPTKVNTNGNGCDSANFEEDGDGESAERLAEMIDDYYFQEQFFEEIIYDDFRYRLEYAKLEKMIMEMDIQMHNRDGWRKYRQFNYRSRIFDKRNDLYLLKRGLDKFRNFKFDPKKYKTFEQEDNIWALNETDRWECYLSWLHLFVCKLKQEVKKLTEEYQDDKMKLNELRQMQDREFMKNADIVGLTTSGAAKRRVLLECLHPKIGDHKQLKPKPAVFKLAKKYNMDCSLFERMINNKMPCSVLSEQHRMRPEIASLIVPTIYPHLANHPSTLHRPKVRGIDKFVYFLTHNHPEDQLPDSSSKQNKHEADILLELCKYLLLNDYKPEEITILATYAGQVWYMKKKRREMLLSLPDLSAVRIAPVDNYQGEENRIILLSLVRSNKENKIGFLGTENRVCVALSRAKEGLYVVGNMDNLTNSSSIWPRIKQQLETMNAIGPRLTLRCERHLEQFTFVEKPADFQAMPKGGCSLMCDTELDCGHKCPSVCHIINQDHASYNCLEKCKRLMCKVEEHKNICPLQCWETCDPCTVRMEKPLPCGHTAHLKCHVDPAAHECVTQVKVPHPACGHEISKPCFRKVEECSCSEPCTTRLPCGHACRKKCHAGDDPDHLKYKCLKACVKELSGCSHSCPMRCHEECLPCEVPVVTTLPCGHSETILCSSDPASIQCLNYFCDRTMTCGHKCKLLCGEPCTPASFCVEMVDKQASCGHLMRMKCNSSPKDVKCNRPCLRNLSCGHPCTAKCFVVCSKVQCKKEVVSTVSPACGHPSFKIPCELQKQGLQSGSDELLQLCSHPCGRKMDCGHPCSGTCGGCMQGRLHVPCIFPCSKILVCGHRCTSKCWQLCPPCYKPCIIKCEHEKCYGKTRINHPCFQICGNPCDRPCKWKCPHYQCSKNCGEECDRPPCYESCREVLRCGHPCIGYCGDPCPPLCPSCDPDNPAIQSDTSAKYVLLEDCKHIIEGTLFDNLITNATLNNTFRLMRCPLCSKDVANTKRSKNVYLRFRKQIVKINTIIANEEVIRLQRKQDLYSRLLASEPTTSASMNSLMKLCSERLPKTQWRDPNMGRIIIASLLHPLALRCCRLWPVRCQVEEEERLRHRLEYISKVLSPRMKMISYQAILQIELLVAQIWRLTSNAATALSWYDVTPYTWKADSELVVNQADPLELPTGLKLSSTLRTRDSEKQWFICEKQHLYVNEKKEPCVICEEGWEEYMYRLKECNKKIEGYNEEEYEDKEDKPRVHEVKEYKPREYPEKGRHNNNYRYHETANVRYDPIGRFRGRERSRNLYPERRELTPPHLRKGRYRAPHLRRSRWQ